MEKMVRILLCLMVFPWIALCGCAHQEPVVIEEPVTPRVVIKEVPFKGQGKDRAGADKEEFFTSSYLYPDMTKGYIENKAFPYVPKVWLVKGGQKIVLVGPELGPPEFATGEIREFNLPPGTHILHIERWQHLPYYGGWKKLKRVEVIKVKVAQFPEKGSWRYWADSYYGWFVIIHPDHSTVYSGYIQP